MKKLMKLMLGALCLVLGTGVAQATPVMGTNTWRWTHSNSWYVDSNWTSVNSAGTPMRNPLATFDQNSFYVYDFTKLENEGEVWNDCPKPIRIVGLIFGENRGTVGLKQWTGANFYFNDYSPLSGAGGTFIRVGTGTTVNFNIPHWDWENGVSPWGPEGPTMVNFEGGGDFRYDVSELRIASGTKFNLYDGTRLTISGNDPNRCTNGLFQTQIVFKHEDSVLSIAADNVRIQAISGDAGRVALNGRTSGIVYGGGFGVDEISFGGYFDGPGTLYLQGGNALKFTNERPFRNGVELKMRTAEVAFGAGAALGEGTPLEMAENGRVAVSESMTVKRLKGGSTMGAVTVASGKAFTVGTPDSTGSDTYSARLTGDGKFVKDGADYTLTLDGVNTYAGGTEVKAGTLKILEPHAAPALADGLVAYYRFDDPTDLYKDEMGSTDLESTSVSAITSVDGVVSGAVHFVKGWIRYTPLKTAKNFGEAGFPINNEPLSLATWVRVEDLQEDDWIWQEEVVGEETDIMIYGHETGGGKYYGFEDNNDKGLSATSANSISTLNAGMTIKDGKWHHLAYTYDGSSEGNRVLYVDGVKRAEGRTRVGPTTSMSIDATEFLWLGGKFYYSYTGAMDELRVYNRVLKADEVDALYKESMSAAAVIVPPERVDEAAQLPAPVAKYTFDDRENAGKDTSGNGYDLTSVGNVTHAASRKGAYGGCAKLEGRGSYFRADAFPAKVPTNGSFTLSLRVQPSGINELAYVFWGKSGSTTAQEFFRAGANSGLLQDQVGSFSTDNDIQLDEPYLTNGGVASSAGNEASWINMVYVYNCLAKKLTAYRDGNLVGSKTYEDAFAASPDVFYLGYRPDTQVSAECCFDDVRIFDRALTPRQVKALTQSLETGSVGPSLPASGTVTINEGATLALFGAGHSVPALEGAGTLEVTRLSSATLNNVTNFTGAVTGLGSLYLNGKVGAGIDFSDFMGMMSLANEIDVSSDALPLVSNANSVVALPSEGTLTIANVGALTPKFVIAEAKVFDGETSDFSGWTYAPKGDLVKNVTFAIEQGDGVQRFVANVTYWVPYRAWNETTRQMEDRMCSGYTVVTNETATFEDGGWYVVKDTVECGSIAVSGTAHLILMDGAKLTAVGGTNEAGIAVTSGNSLTIYGQTLGTGELVAKNTWGPSGYGGACIGGVANGGCGTVTINGGVITTICECYGAGIGGGAYGGTGGVITINGGKVVACGMHSAGIGGAVYGAGGVVTINGGTVDASHGYTAADIGGGNSGPGAAVTINGGSVKAETIQNAPKNSGNEAVWRVTVECGVQSAECGVKVEGLDGYGTNDIYSIDGKAYLYLPNGNHLFRVNGQWYWADVNGGATAARAAGNPPFVRVISAQQRWPWNGKMDIPYALAETDAAKTYQLVTAVTVGGVTKQVTNELGQVADGSYKTTVDCAALFGTAVAQETATVKLAVQTYDKPAIAIAPVKPLYGPFLFINLTPDANGKFLTTECDYSPLEAWNGTDGWADAYKRDYIVLRKVEAGTYPGYGGNQKTTSGYWIGVFEVTEAQYDRVMGVENPSGSLVAKGKMNYDTVRGTSDPSTAVTGESFMAKLCEKCVDEQGNKVEGFDLPTEWQWNIAYCAGTTTQYYWGDTTTDADQYEWYADSDWSKGSGNKGTQKVGLKKPNAWGLYDIAGNVKEWCRDVYNENDDVFNAISDADQYNTKVDLFAQFRSRRGGSWLYGVSFCARDKRDGTFSDVAYSEGGFRLSRTSTK